MLGSDLAEQIRQRHEGSPLGELMSSIAAVIEEDRQQLVDLMKRMDISQNPIKQATGWLAEKASHVKFSGVGSGEPHQNAFMRSRPSRLVSRKGEHVEGPERGPERIPGASGD